MFSQSLISAFNKIETPFYFYDTSLLHNTLNAVNNAASLYNYNLHYAIKANSNKKILDIIRSYNLGADCVSGNEIKAAISSGFNPSQIVFAGVGKTNKEIEFAIDQDIFSINVESEQELEVINRIAKQKNKFVRVALRLNPNVDAKTHKNITTGLKTNKFGINYIDYINIITNKNQYANLIIDGLHFHIGSQITDLSVFASLCRVVNNVFSIATNKGVQIKHVNLGGGLGINYSNPDNQIPDFKTYFNVFYKYLDLPDNVNIHFEPGRSIIGQCGYLLSRVLFKKENDENTTLILDSGFTELMRPALYQAKHKILNINNSKNKRLFDIAGPICESSDYFGTNIELADSKRGDILAIFSAGAYGEVMSSNYNLRTKAKAVYSNQLSGIF